MEKETRVMPSAEVRAITDEDGKPTRIQGYAIRFNELSSDLGGWREEIAPDAVKLDPDMRALWNHNTDYVLGRQSAGTLTVETRSDGVWFDVEPPDTSWGRDALTSVARGDVDQCSFAMYCLDDSWEKRDGMNVRTVKSAEVLEVSPVAIPAYPTTSAQARDAAAAMSEAPVEGESVPEPEPEESDADRIVDPRFYDPEVILG